ncbi:MAG: redoxin family protein [Epsilonproteobacteria bacterium]|nr:redoxin family protein [Campylobacterota bacterium]
MLKKSITTILLVSTLVFLGCSSDKDEQTTQQANDMISANEYVLTALDNKQYVVKKDGADFILKDTDAKVVIFDIFATWCPPCRGAATHLNALQKKYKNKIKIIGLHIENDIPNSKLQDFREKYNAHYTLVNSKENRRLADTIVDELKLGDRYPIPIMALYKDGKYVNHFIGSIEEELVESEIKSALGR